MSLLPSLWTALEGAGGDRLVMRSGERPHVVAGEHRHDVASAALSVDTVDALVEQLLSPAARRELAVRGTVSESLQSPSFPHALIAKADRGADQVSIELIASSCLESPDQAQSEMTDEAPTEPLVSRKALGEPDAANVADGEWLDRAHDSRSQAQVPRPEPRALSPESRVLAWIRRAASLGASTLYVRAGSSAVARINERIQPLDEDSVVPADVADAVEAFTRGDDDGLWERSEDGEWVHESDELGRIGCRVFTDLQGSGLVIRFRPVAASRLLHKHIPRQVRTACDGEGLVVITAPTEADVEAFAAAVADWSSRHRGGYVISLRRRSRSPRDIAGAFVSHRTIDGTDRDFAAAIRRAAQESPDILLVTALEPGQASDATVLAAAGRLVVAGVVAATTADALRTLAGTDPDTRQALTASFRAALGCRRVRRLGGGRTLIREVVVASGAVCSLLEAGDFDGLHRVQSEAATSMRSLDASLARAVKRRHVSLREAASHAVDRRRLVTLVRGRQSRA